MTGNNNLDLCDAELFKAIKFYLTSKVFKDKQFEVISVLTTPNNTTRVVLKGSE